MTNITYWGDMLNAVNAYVTANYGTLTPIKGPMAMAHWMAESSATVRMTA